MRASPLAALLALLGGACARTPAPPAIAPPPSTPDLRFDLGALDRAADPCVDFYDYACGGWRATHPVPPDQTSWSRYAEMTATNRERERTIVEEAARGGADASEAERRVGAFYAACLDEAGIETRGLAPLREALAPIEAIRTRRDALDAIAALQAHDVYALFGAYADTDPGDTRQGMLWLDRGDLGLPNVADYASPDEASVAVRARYVEHLARVFRLLGDPDAEAALAASRTLALETKLAARALSPVERRHRDAQLHPMTVAELAARYPAIDWPAWLARIGAPALERVNVAQPAWLDAVNETLAADDLAGVRDQLRMLVVRASATMLPASLEQEAFDFDQRALAGAKEMAPRWRRCLAQVDRHIGDDVGRVFVARYFPDDARDGVRTMVDALVAAYADDIATREWLGEPARAAARAKLAQVLVVLGASNRPRSLDGLRVERDDPFGNAWRARAFYVADDLGKVGKPADRERFFDSLPQETDAFGSKPKNAVGFTAGFLQPPLYDPRVDDAVNYGGLGSVIGHELSHRFDDEGRRYDGEGNLRDWWSPDDVTRFQARAQCFVDEYARFRAEDGSPVDGRLTLGENIADNGGIRLSYAALRPAADGPRIDGFTPAQRFFLAWGQIRCENVTPERARLDAATNPHAPGRWRVDGVVSNMPEFAAAFGCPAGSPMAPAERCEVW